MLRDLLRRWLVPELVAAERTQRQIAELRLADVSRSGFRERGKATPHESSEPIPPVSSLGSDR